MTMMTMKKTTMDCRKTIAFFDLETTDRSIDSARVCMISIKLLDKETLKVIDSYKKYVNPTVPVTNEAYKVHGLDNTFLSNYLTFKSLAYGIKDFIEDSDLGGYNILNFDIPILQKEFELAGIEIDLADRKYFDAFNIFKRDTPRTLTAAYQYYTGKTLENAHDASADIEATVEIFIEQLKDHKDMDMEELASYSVFDQAQADPMNKFYFNKDKELCFSFGKHKGFHVKSVDPSYLDWILSLKDFPKSSKATLKKYLSK